MAELKQSLDEQTKQPKNNAPSGMDDGPLVLDHCGPSSLQRFSGEDHMFEIRKKAQQEQVKFWCAEYMVERNRALNAERKEKEDYANYVLEQDRIRSELEEEARRRKDEEARRRQLENMEYARQARERKEQEMRAESQYLQTCPLLTEDTKLATNVNAQHRYRPDHFKGFEKDKVSQIYKENDAVVEEKRSISQGEAKVDAEWARHHENVVLKMSEAEEAKQRMIAEENRVHREILAKQKRELEERKARMEKERLPEISSEFFSRKFGQSCR